MSGAVKQAKEVGAGDDTSIVFFLSFFLSFSFSCYGSIFFMKITFIFSCFGIFRDIPGCSVFPVLSTPN